MGMILSVQMLLFECFWVFQPLLGGEGSLKSRAAWMCFCLCFLLRFLFKFLFGYCFSFLVFVLADLAARAGNCFVSL